MFHGCVFTTYSVNLNLGWYGPALVAASEFVPPSVCAASVPAPQKAAQGAERDGDQARADARRQKERACSSGVGAIQDTAHNRTLAIQI